MCKSAEGHFNGVRNGVKIKEKMERHNDSQGNRDRRSVTDIKKDKESLASGSERKRARK